MEAVEFYQTTLEALRELREISRKEFNLACDWRDWESAEAYGDEVQRIARAIQRVKRKMKEVRQ